MYFITMYTPEHNVHDICKFSLFYLADSRLIIYMYHSYSNVLSIHFNLSKDWSRAFYYISKRLDLHVLAVFEVSTDNLSKL